MIGPGSASLIHILHNNGLVELMWETSLSAENYVGIHNEAPDTQEVVLREPLAD